ncbi:hypothetical protein ACFL57_01200 [Candidatus Margulisiibacteriota bacterium]
MPTHQRIGSISNTHVGREFEDRALKYLTKHGYKLERNIKIELGVADKKKKHSFEVLVLNSNVTPRSSIIIQPLASIIFDSISLL